MDFYRKNAIIVGVFFIIATAASIISTVFLGSTLAAPVSLNTVNASETSLMIAALLQFIAALSAFGTAVTIYPILKRHTESLAISYVGLRLLENVFYILGVVSLLILLTMGQEYVAGTINTSYQPLTSLVLALQDWSLTIGTVIIFGIGSIVLNYVLYQSRLIPRWLSVWGIIGAVLVILYGLLGISVLHTDINSTLTILAAPIAVQEMLFAVWLIVKGYNKSAITYGSNQPE